MADWNPSLYLQYGAERTRPAAELLARIPLDDVATLADLGCGPGNSTALLRHRWPNAQITGVDNSPAMLEEARSALPGCRFVESDIRQYKPDQALNLIYANASLQWVPDHYDLLPHLVSLLALNGVLAIQMPDNWLEPTHVAMREVALEQDYPDRGREPLPGSMPTMTFCPKPGVRWISGGRPISIKCARIRPSLTGSAPPGYAHGCRN
jgi:trans-aconitate 2-methyltransferase